MSKPTRPRRPLIEAIEPRLLFSATADIAVFDNHNDAQHLNYSAEQVDLEQIYLKDPNPLLLENEPPSTAKHTEESPSPVADHTAEKAQALATNSPAEDPVHQLVFVDKSINNYETLVADIRNNNPNTAFDVIYLDTNENGVDRISQTLAHTSNISAVHILSHGISGNFKLGNQLINENTINNYSNELHAWGNALTADADILIYSCDVTADQSGIQLINSIGQLTGADVAASNDDTGNLKNADWVLESHTGVIETHTLLADNSTMQWDGVLPNNAPTVANILVDQIATKGSAFSYQFASNSFNDADGNTLTYTATLQSGSVLPSWLSFNSGTRTFSGTPSNINDVTAFTVRVTANDGNGGTVYDDFVIQVKNKIEAESYNNSSGVSTESTTDTGGGLDVGFFDPNDWYVYYTGSGNPVLPTTGTYTIDFRVASATGGQFYFSDADNRFTNIVKDVTVANTGGWQNWQTYSYKQTITHYSNFGFTGVAGNTNINWFQVTPNDTPTVSHALADQSAYQNNAFSYQFTAQNVANNVFNDADTLTYSATLSSGAALPSWLTFNAGTRTFSGTPASGDIGSITVRVTATDGYDSVFDDFIITTANTNDAPHGGATNGTYSEWTYNKNITLDTTAGGANVASTQTNFPVLIRLTSTNFDFSKAQSNGQDIRFTDNGGTALSYEIESWDSGTNTANIWVKVPTLTGNAQTTIKMYWGNTAASSAGDGASVFGSNSTVAAFHFNDNAATTTVTDSTGTQTATHIANTNAQSTTGIIGNAFDFDGTTDYVNVADNNALDFGTGNFTISAWVQLDQTTGQLWSKRDANSDYEFQLLNPGVLDAWVTDISTASHNSSTISLSTGVWYHITFERSGTNGYFYINGAQDANTLTSATGNVNTAVAGTIGRDNFVGNEYFDGRIDEMRISNTARSADWIKLEYQNQKAADSLVTMSAAASFNYTNSVNAYEDVAYAFTAADFGFADSDDSPANTLTAVKISTLPATGTIKLSGVAISAGQTISVANINSGLLTYTSGTNGSGTAYSSFTFQVQDNGGTANGGVDLDQSPNTLAINVTALNDAPAGTDKTITGTEEVAYILTTADFGFTDPNDSPANTLTAVKITTLPTAGSLTLNGVAVTTGQTVSVANINSNLLVFTPAANGAGSAYSTFTFQVQDNGGTANGGVDLDQSANTITFNITGVNDAPAGTNKTITTLEDTAYTLTAADFGFTDPNDSPANALTAVKIASLPVAGTLKLNGVTVSLNQTVSVSNINSGLLIYTPATNANGNSYSSFTFQVQDDGGTANSGVDLDQSANTITFNVTAVNDAPAGTDKTITFNEDASHTMTAADFGFTDTSDSPANTLTAVKIASLPVAGSLKLSGVAVSLNQTISVANINSGLLIFTPAAGGNGTSYASFTFQVQDTGGTTNGGIDLDPTANTITFDVTSINDAPAGADKTITINEDASHTFTAADFGFTDTGDSPADNLLAVKIDSLPVGTSLKLNGVAVVQNQIISIANINSGLLVFTPPANANGTNYTNFAFQVQDDGGTSNGGVDLDQSANIITFNVTSVNDAPTVANALGDQNATEDSAFSYQFASNTFSDTEGDTLTYTALLSGGGALPAWLTFNSATRTFSGTPLNANVGVITIDVTANDGHSGTVTDTFTITVANTNDAPTVANAIPDRNATENSAFSYQFASNTFNDVDVGDTLTYSAQLNGGGALPAWLSFNSATRTFSGTPANGDIGTLSIDVTANDGHGSTVTDTFNIVVSAGANNLPTVANAIPDQNATEDSAFNFQFASNTFNDVDVSNTLTYSAQLNGGASLPSWLSFNAGTRTFSGTPTNADVGTLTIDVTADDGHGGTVTDTFTIAVANTNDAPTVANTISNQSATEDSAFSFQFPANTFADVDVGDTLTYSATLNSGAILPAWLSFNAATRTFSGTPDDGDVGTVTVKVTASDGNGGSVFTTFDLTVVNVNETPFLLNPFADQNATEDSLYSFSFNANVFSDPDIGDTFTYTATLGSGAALPTWLTLNSGTRTFSGTPTNSDVGTISVKLIGTDSGGLTAEHVFNLTVANSNDAPTVANAIPDQNATEDSAFSFQFASNSFADVDVGATLTYSAQLNGGGALPAWLSFNSATRTFSGTPTNAFVGTVNIDVIADDGNGGTVSDTFAITVTNTNDAPTLANAIPDQNATEDAAFNFQFASNTFNDVDVSDTLIYSAQLNGGGALPSWLSFNAATRTFSGTPTNSDVGTINIDVSAFDGNGGSITDTFAITVANTNDAPTVANAIPDQNATEDSAFNFQFASNTFNDVDVGDTLTYTAQLNGGGALPSWLSFNAATRTFSGTPTNAFVGTVNIDVTADDGHGGTVTDTFAITVANTNDAPTVANAIPDQNATEDSAFNFQFASNTFNDVDVGDTLTYSAQLNGGGALPSWLSFNAATRTFSGTPTNAFVGTVNIDVTADDGHGGTVTDTFAIIIANTNDAPTVANAIPDQNATEDSAFNFQFASNTFNDVDVGDTLTYSAQLNGGGALPSWLSFNAATRTFSGTPTNADVGTITLDVTADDGHGGTITDTFAIVIANANDAPTVANAIPDQNATEDSAFNFQFASNTFNDIDVGDTLTYTTQLNGGGALPSWLSFNAATRTFSGTPTNADVGTLTIDVTADDGHGGTVTDTFAIVIANANDAPTVANAIPDQNATEDSAFNFQFASNTFNDVDVGDTLTYTAQLNGGGALPSWLSFNAATRTFSGTPTNADIGTITLDVTADDGHGGTITDTFAIVIANANDAPTVANAIPDQNATEDSAFNFQFASNTFNDVDVGDTLTYTAQLNGGGALPAWLSFNAATRTFSGTPTNADVGTITLDVTADDGHGGTVTDTFAIVIANANDAPTVANAIPVQNATEDSAFNFQFASNTFNDVDVGDTLTYSAQLNGGGALPSWLSFNAGTRTFSGTPTNAFVGTVNIDVTAVDGHGGTVTDTFTITVANTNDAPTVANAIPDQNATEDSAFNFQFASNSFNDVDVGDTLTYSAQLNGGGALPAWLSFNAATRTFSGTPTNADIGTITLDVTADDGHGGTITDTFAIVITNANDAPTVANAIPDQNATEDSAFNFQFASNTFNDVDVGDTLTYTAQLNGGGALPAWLNFNAATRTFSGTPTNADVGTITLDVTSDDGHGGTITDTFAIVIANANDAPTVANAIPDQNATEDSAFNFQFASNTFNDVDVGDTLTYTAQLNGGGALPAWLNFNAATRTFSGTPTNADVGTITLDVTADDGHGGTVTDTFAITVANANDAPTVANAIPDQNATEDTAFNFQFASNTFNDVDVGDTLTYTAQLNGGGALPSWLNFNAATRTFSGTPTNADIGTITLDVTADDGHGGTITDTFAIVIANANDAPTVANAIPDQNATEDSAFNFQFASNTFNDVDVGDTLTYSAQLNGGGALPSWLNFNAATRTFSGTPTNADVGTITLDVTSDDGHGGTITDTFAIVIANTNDAPTVANAIPDQNATEDSAFNFQFASNTFNDVDVGDTLTYSAQLNGGGALPSWLNFNAATRTFSGTPTNADVGTITLDVTADDGHGGTITDTFAIVIANANDAPTVANAIPDQNATEDTAFNFQFASNTFNDVDVGDVLTYSAQLNGGGAIPSWLSFNAATRTFSGTPTNTDIGTITLDVTADDGHGGTITDTFAIVIANANDAPTVVNAIPDQNATEDTAFNFQFASNTFNDVDVGDVLTYSAQLNGGGALPSWLSFHAATRTFSGTPTNADIGTITLDVTADDGHGGTITDTFALNIAALPNNAPTTTGILNINTTENSSGDSVNLFAAFSDKEEPSNQLTYSIVNNSNATLITNTVIDTQTGLLHLNYGTNQFGSGDITVRATDAQGASVDTTFTVNVAFVNNVPTTTGISNIQAAVGDTSTTLNLSNLFNDVEDGKKLTYTIVNNTNPAIIDAIKVDPQTGTVSIVYNQLAAGDSKITIRATDSNNASVDASFTVSVPTKNVENPTDTHNNNNNNNGTTTPTKPTDNSSNGTTTPSNPGTTDPTTPTDPKTPDKNPNNTSVVIDPNSINHLPTSGGIDTTHVEALQTQAPEPIDHNRYDRIVQHLANTSKNVELKNVQNYISNLILPGEGFTSQDIEQFKLQLRKVHQEMQTVVDEEQQHRSIIAAVSLSVTTGVIIWALRASSLLLALMSMLPLWRGMDPLPILDQVNNRKKQLEEQRKDKKKEDKNTKEVGYLFDNTSSDDPKDK